MEEVTYKNREEMVYQVLKKEILDLELKPGQLIKETEICERFSVSRTPVRDALRLLQEQGFVITVPYRGIYVTLLSLSNIKQMIYMRVAVETMVSTDMVVLAGEVTSRGTVDVVKTAREVIRDIGYTEKGKGFDADTCMIFTNLHNQSPDISMGVGKGTEGEKEVLGGGDQALCMDMPQMRQNR